MFSIDSTLITACLLWRNNLSDLRVSLEFRRTKNDRLTSTIFAIPFPHLWKWSEWFCCLNVSFLFEQNPSKFRCFALSNHKWNETSVVYLPVRFFFTRCDYETCLWVLLSFQWFCFRYFFGVLLCACMFCCFCFLHTL